MTLSKSIVLTMLALAAGVLFAAHSDYRDQQLSTRALYGSLETSEVSSLRTRAGKNDVKAIERLLMHFGSVEQQRVAPDKAKLEVRQWALRLMDVGDRDNITLALNLVWKQDGCSILQTSRYVRGLERLKLADSGASLTNEINRRCVDPGPK